jgi:hypothetical protein
MSLNAAMRLHEILDLLTHLLSIHLAVSFDAIVCNVCPPEVEKLYQEVKDVISGRTPSERIATIGKIWL